MDFNPTTLLAGGAAVGLVAAFWSQLRRWVAWLISFVVVTVHVEDRAAYAVASLCWQTMKPSRFGARRYQSMREYVRPAGRRQVVGFESVGQSPLVFWAGWKPLILRYASPPSGAYLVGGVPVVVTFLRWTFDADALVVDAIRRLNRFDQATDPADEDRVERFKITRVTGLRQRANSPVRFGHGGDQDKGGAAPTTVDDERAGRRFLEWSINELGAPRPAGGPLATLALSAQTLDTVTAIRRWLDSKAWYEERRIPWRFGVAYYGKPGNGKSSLVRGIAQEFDLPVFAFDLSTFGNSDFAAEWERLLTHTPCVALFEDIDTVFDGRENVTATDESPGLTFDCLLNCISGVGDASGILTIVTTNRVERLDAALGQPGDRGTTSRPGRIDRAVELGPPDEAGRRRIAERILAGCPDEIPGVVRTAGNAFDSGAQFEDRCARIALAHYWNHHPSRPTAEETGPCPSHQCTPRPAPAGSAASPTTT